jgi:hypothetical protein
MLADGTFVESVNTAAAQAGIILNLGLEAFSL